ncbi:MAG: biotin--[acetyl-CoA-carboxylase] ligase [Candidatus Aegiribacteria sp.]|nr:biotin--[acetyl-CoA-carboxylase] ligase [Candidatus Aegiribacteria sp.]
MDKISSGILEMLRTDSDYISGQQISTEFGITRAAIWKHIRDLRKTGYIIEAIPNKGYHLSSSPDMPFEEEIHCFLSTRTIGETVIFHREIDSTNNVAMLLASDGAPHGTVITSDSQTGGRGRRGRDWFSPPGCNLYMSVILRPSVSPAEASQIPVISVIAVVRVLEQLDTGLHFQIKWPNDILCHRKKVCGILCEMKSDTDRINHVVVGIGINVNVTSMDPCISDIATSLKLETDQEYSRIRLSASILEELEGIYLEWLQERNLKRYIAEWKKYSLLIGRNVRIETPSETIAGVATGLSDSGSLIVKLPSGAVREVYAGDAHIANHNS